MEMRESEDLSRVPSLLKAKLRMRPRSAGFSMRRGAGKGQGKGVCRHWKSGAPVFMLSCPLKALLQGLAYCTLQLENNLEKDANAG